MLDILVRAGCFIAIILLGMLLRRVGLFRREDFNVLSTVVIKITLPASIIFSFSGKEIDPALLSLALIGFAAGLIYIAIGWITNRKGGRNHQAFALVNLPGYNIGCFTMPFVQTFIGPAGVIVTSLFDVGNAFVCLGGSFSLAAAVVEGSGFSFRRMGRSMVRSVPLLCYVVMVILRLLDLSLPAPVVSLAEIIGNANAFLAMFMIGIGFRLEADRTQIGRIVKHLVTRYAVAAALALLFWFVLPFDEFVRQVLVLLVFSPIGSAAPAYTAELKNDVGLASAVNSLAIVTSIVIMVILMMVLF